MWISDTRPIQCYSMTRVTVWLQCYGSQFSGSQFYGAKVLRLQFYGPNVRVPDTTEPRTWLIRQSASLLPPFAAVMSSSPPPPFVKWTHSSPPSVPVPVPPHSDHPLWPTPPLRLLSSSVSPSVPNLPLSYFLWSQSSLLLLLLPQLLLLAERKRLSDQFYYYHYNNHYYY